ncbi:MAG: VWA domain-containing protein [Acidimicrobiaceae bacterium]|nr:VWA domain-containing protein [Acidimicrobiaceae bacterium]
MARPKPLRKLRRPELQARPEPVRFAYSRWDGSQTGFELDADHIFDEVADDLLYHGALTGALRRLMADGLRDRAGRDIEGLRSMLERLREQRRRLLEQLQALDGADFASGEAVPDLAELRERISRQMMQQGAGKATPERRCGDTTQQGDTPQLQQLLDALSRLAEIDQLERLLQSATNPSDLLEADLEAVRGLLGGNAASGLQGMAQMADLLAEARLIDARQPHPGLTPRAIRKIGQNALRDLFSRLDPDMRGRHSIARAGPGHEREPLTKPYSYGDPFNLHIGQTIRNAVARTGGGVPVRLHSDDFEVEQTEQQVRSATVLMIDLSLSMPMRNNFLPAKKVAMALQALISNLYPNDYLGLVSFGETARELRPEQLPDASWDYVYGTNMHHGLMLARAMLRRQTANRQIIMITDGEPTAHLTASGRAFFSYPPIRETLDLTLAEVAGCTREGIRINTFMLDATSQMTGFVEQVTALNGGRAFFATNENLGDYVLVDFVAHKRSLVTVGR